MARKTLPRPTIARPLRCAFAIASLALVGCGARVDMTKMYDADQAHTMIQYTGVRDETRQYGDYGAIHADVLTSEADAP